MTGEGQAVVMMWKKSDAQKRIYIGIVHELEWKDFDPNPWSIVVMYNYGGGIGKDNPVRNVQPGGDGSGSPDGDNDEPGDGGNMDVDDEDMPQAPDDDDHTSHMPGPGRPSPTHFPMGDYYYQPPMPSTLPSPGPPAPPPPAPVQYADPSKPLPPYSGRIGRDSTPRDVPTTPKREEKVKAEDWYTPDPYRERSRSRDDDQPGQPAPYREQAVKS